VAGYDDDAADDYDQLHADAFAEAEATADALAALAGDGPVLELGVGTGRLALPLAARGLEVHGIDASPAMVERLRQKPGGNDIRVVIGDFTEVGSVMDGVYTLAFVAYNTLFNLTTQHAQKRCLAGVAARLAPGGVFVVEAFVPDVTVLEQSVSALRVDTDSVVIQVTRHDPGSQRVELRDLTLRPSGVSAHGFPVRYATVAEIDVMAELAGLRLRERWGGWRREPFTGASRLHVSVYEK